MFNNVALDVFIGLVFVFLLYSLLATIVQEIIATRFAFRAKVLEKAILRMLDDGKTASRFSYVDRMNGVLHIFNLKNLLKGKKVAPWFYVHPLIKYLAEDNWYSKPAYISASNFSKVMIDLLKGFDQPESQAIQAIHESITAGVIHKLPISTTDTANPAIKIIRDQHASAGDPAQLRMETVPMGRNTAFFLQTLWQDSGADIEVFKTKLEQWFDDTMKRATGWYKKYTRIVLFVIGLAMAYWLNVDTFAIRRILSRNDTAREQMVQMAISSSEHLDPSKILATDSSGGRSQSLLDSTYRIVAADAAKTQNVLGLGKPWRDTACICKDSLNDKSFKSRFAALQKNDSVNKSNMAELTAAMTLHLHQINALLDNANNADTVSVLKQKLASDSAQLKQLQEIPQTEYNDMLQLQQRCAYISRMRAHRWNLYSPNQAGGWETFFGWIITAFAIMLGAPFWFDLLGKLTSLRGTGVKANSSESSAGAGSVGGDTPNPVTVNVNTNPGEEAVG